VIPEPIIGPSIKFGDKPARWTGSSTEYAVNDLAVITFICVSNFLERGTILALLDIFMYRDDV